LSLLVPLQAKRIVSSAASVLKRYDNNALTQQFDIYEELPLLYLYLGSSLVKKNW